MPEIADVVIKTSFKMFGVPANGQLSREDWEKVAAKTRDTLQKLNPKEAANVYQAFMALADLFGLDKYARDGGLSYSMREMEIVRRVLSRKELADVNRVLHYAYFRAIDTNGDGVIQRKEWSNFLKIQGTYVSETQANESFDSVDSNKNGTISLAEFVEYAVDFWCCGGSYFGAKNLYGTKDI